MVLLDEYTILSGKFRQLCAENRHLQDSIIHGSGYNKNSISSSVLFANVVQALMYLK